MRPRRLVLVALLVAPLATAAEPSGPRLSIEPVRVDFGRVLQHRALQAQFRLRNFGDGELQVTRLSADCDCAAALLDERDRRLAPGASATLSVRLETRRSLGRIVRHVRVDSNDAAQPTVTLELVADVRAGR
jgi:hypothetical protein